MAKGGEMLGAACVQVAFNLGNAIGAYVGGLAISGGYRYPALAGVPFAMVGFILFLTFYKKYQAKYLKHFNIFSYFCPQVLTKRNEL